MLRYLTFLHRSHDKLSSLSLPLDKSHHHSFATYRFSTTSVAIKTLPRILFQPRLPLTVAHVQPQLSSRHEVRANFHPNRPNPVTLFVILGCFLSLTTAEVPCDQTIYQKSTMSSCDDTGCQNTDTVFFTLNPSQTTCFKTHQRIISFISTSLLYRTIHLWNSTRHTLP